MINSRYLLTTYNALINIPQGKVTTYSILAKQVGCKNPRLIGKILHQNPDPKKYPCYKVVNYQGKVSSHYAFGGKQAQIQKLKRDKIDVKNGQVDLHKYLWNFA